jgi:Mg2+ and Co2+ transporter CorA
LREINTGVMNARVSATDDDRLSAERVADWLRSRSTETRTWYEIRTLLHDFSIDRFTDDAKGRITTALAEVGIAIDPALETRDRRDTVLLAWAANGADKARPKPWWAGAQRNSVTERAVHADGTCAVVPADAGVDLGGVVARWFDVHDPPAVQSAPLTAFLGPRCPGLTKDMIGDLISPDPRPKVVYYDAGRIRSLSTFRVRALESDEGADPESRSKAGVLSFDPVEILVGPGWMLTCWHETQQFRGPHRLEEGARAPHDDVYAAVEAAWRSSYSGAGDLAVLLLLELANTYKPTCRQLRVWVEEWELDYFRTDHAYDDTLLEVQASVAVLRDWLSPLNISGMTSDIHRAWFPGVSGDKDSGGYERALRVDDRVDQSLAELVEISSLVRNAYELLEVRRLKLAQDRDARFQRTIAIGGSAILIPTLVAGVMGANTWVPGEYGPNSAKWAFGVLLLIMVISAAAAWYALKRMHERGP